MIGLCFVLPIPLSGKMEAQEKEKHNWRESVMKSLLSIVLVFGFALAPCVAADAGTRVNEVWNCKLKDGKTLKDVHALCANINETLNGA
jgi:hypothetical protein